MKIAVIGATGQLGHDLVRVLSKDHEVIGLSHADIEVTDLKSCKILEKIKPDVIINTAAYHNVPACEENPEKAFLVNAIGARNVALIGKQIGATVIYISTDYVFDGRKKAPYDEDDVPNPLNAYAISKLAGEFFTRYAPKHYIIRVASLFGVRGCRAKGGLNFVEVMIQKAKKGETIKVVNDVYMSPTYTFDAAKTIKLIIERNLPYGVYHVTNQGVVSWYEFAKAIFELLSWDVNLIPVTSSEFPSKVRRPKFSALISKKLPKYGIQMRHWKEALKDYLIEKGHLKI